VGCASVNEDRVTGPWVYFSAVTGKYLHVAQIAQVASGSRGEFWINLDRSDTAIGTYDLS